MQPRNKKNFGMNTISPSSMHDSTRIEQVCISSFDNTILSAYLLKNHESKKMVILIHGYGSSAKNMVQYISFFEKKGYSVLLPDLRGHGKSGGIYSGLSISDAKDIKKWIENYSDSYMISLFGTSMGGLTALRTLVEYPELNIQFCITDSSPCSMLLLVEKVFNWRFPDKWKLFRNPFIFYLKHIAKIDPKEDVIIERLDRLDVPVLLMHGKKDGLVPFSMCINMYEHIKSSKEIVLFETTDHVQSINNADYWDKVNAFMSKYSK